MWLDLNLDGMETPSDSGSLPFPIYDPQGERSKALADDHLLTETTSRVCRCR